MDSIHKAQAEDSFGDLYGASAVTKLQELTRKTKTGFFCTEIKTASAFQTRPMTVQKVDDSGTFWFLSASDSQLNEQLKRDPSAQILMQGSSYSDFLTVYGVTNVSQDKAKIEELWEPLMKDWFTGGKDDPRITVISLRPREGYYWDTKHGAPVAFAKMVVGAVLGKTLDDSVQGNIRV
jgi:general stress protein 26